MTTRHVVSEARPTGTSTVSDAEDPLGFDRVESIIEDDAFLAAAIADSDLPSLLAALALTTQDESLIADELRPPLPPMSASAVPQGGMDELTQALARDRALLALAAYRDAGCPAPQEPTGEWLQKVMLFLSADAGKEFLPLLRHEINIPVDMGKPTWTKQELAPDRPFTVAVIGAGLSGIGAAHRFRQAGVNVVVFEKNEGVGGTWAKNIYPGCRLDTPNYAYSFTFAQKPDWPQQFSTQPEILRYLEHVADGLGIVDDIQFGTEVRSATYDEQTAMWRVVTESLATGERHEHTVNAIFSAIGQLDRPSYPDIPGRETYGGHSFHSATWDADVDLTGLRVAVIGAGASAYQIIPAISGTASHLDVFIRNAPWLLPTPHYHHDIKPGMHWLLRHVPYYGRWYRFWQFLLSTEGRMKTAIVDENWQHPVSVSAANEEIRILCADYLEKQFSDRPDLLEKVMPNYPPGAKRMLRDNGAWAQTLKRDDTELISSAISEITPTGIRTADGELHEVDVIIYATGFQAADFLAPMKITGREGRNIHDFWGGDCRAYLGIVVPSFPNFFFALGPNTGTVVNSSSVFISECAIEFAVRTVGELLETGARAIDVDDETYWRYNDWIDEGNRQRAWGHSSVSSWYKNSSGRASQIWPFSMREFWDTTHPQDYSAFSML
jgi:4-hydroxyacetophenone monooxygenase